MLDFKTKYGPWAIVAGASEGLGAAFAEALAKRGLNLILIARRIEKLEVLSSALRNTYQIDIRFHSIDLSDLYKIIDVNIRAPLLLTKLLSRKMIEKRKGGIILMSSLSGTQGSSKIATYAASKAFNTIFAEGIWKELKKHEIDVLASCAGAVRTPGYINAQHEKDVPGTLDANQVAEKTLNAIGKGPTTIPGLTNKLAHFIMGRIIPRKWAISIMDKNTTHLS
jgi:short-subunit dehydrogenase